MAWTDVNFNIQVASSIDAAANTLDSAADLVDAGLSIISPIVDILALVQRSLDGDVSAFDTFIDQAINILDLDDSKAGAYVLNIPIRKINRTALSTPDVPVRSLGDLAKLSSLRLPPSDVSGGNYGVYHAFVESLYDEGDLNRPSLDPEAYTGLFLLVYGGSSYVNVLQTLLGLNRLFIDLVPIPFDNYTLPVPQDSKLRVVPTSSTRVPSGSVRVEVDNGTSPKSAVLRWNKIAPVLDLLAFGATTLVTVESWTIYVKEGSRILPTEDLSTYAKETFELNKPTVNAQVGTLYQGNLNKAYLTGFDEDKEYFVSVGFNVTVADVATGESTTVLHDPATLGEQHRVAMVDKRIPTKFTRGIPPDWVGIERSFDLFPIVRDTVETAIDTLTTLKRGTTSTETTLQRTLGIIQGNVDKVREITQTAAGTIGALTSIAAGLSGGIYANTLIGQGGDALLIQHVGEQLLDPNIENQPPFRDSNSIAGALAVVVQFETEADVSAFLAPFDALFGGATTPVQDAIEELQPPTTTTVVETETTTPTTQLDTLGVDDNPC